MIVNIKDIPEGKNIDDYPDETSFRLTENEPRYLLNPFEVIGNEDPRYDKALTKKEMLKYTE